MTLPTSLSIKPSPRILRVLGDIEFEPWQCIAELIDNAFDDFLEVHRRAQHWPDGFKVSVSLPSQASADAMIVIEDTGRGMSLGKTGNATVVSSWSGSPRPGRAPSTGVTRCQRGATACCSAPATWTDLQGRTSRHGLLAAGWAAGWASAPRAPRHPEPARCRSGAVFLVDKCSPRW